MKNNWTTEQKKEIGKLLDEMFILVMDAPRLKGDEPFNAKEQFKKDKGLLPKLEVGKWYKLTQDYANRLKSGMVFPFKEYQSPLHRYATVIHSIYLDTPLDGSGKDYLSPPSSDLVPATNQEVLEALTKEAEKRGLKEGVNVKSLVEGHKGVLCGSPVYDNEDGELWCILEQYNILLFCDGIWATIVDEPNQELEALKKKYQELGKEIENLENK